MTKLEEKKITEGYLEAARLIREGKEEFSCIAIRRAFKLDSCHLRHVEISRYINIFSPKRLGNQIDKMDSLLNALPFYKQGKNHREILLSLMAVCWKDFR